MTQAIKELAEKRRKWVAANRANGFEEGLKHLLTDLYPDNAHFIYELLQNAEDAHAQKVRFSLYGDRIEFEHDGEKLFTIEDVDAITSIGFSTKINESTNIGKFGVGFKAVFAYTDSPEVKSGEFHFKIQDMVIPKPKRVSPVFSKKGQTRFILPFDNPKKSPAQATLEIETLLKKLGATTLLFLSHIQKIEYLLVDSSRGSIERMNRGDNRFEIRLRQPNEHAHSYMYLKFEKEVQVEDDEAENGKKHIKSCSIAVAFGLMKADKKGKKGGGTDSKSEWELQKMQPGRVCIYFPADKETSNLRFHLHAPFASTVGRDSVRDCAGNKELRNHLADLLAESMSAIRDHGLLNVRSLALLPNEKDNPPEFYKPLMDRLIREFHKKNLVPMKRGGHAAAAKVFRGSRALSDLIDDDDMVLLLGNGCLSPIWASNPPQRNQREDNFFSMLGIKQWDVAELVNALKILNKDVLGQWLGRKKNTWHKRFYEMLMNSINEGIRQGDTKAKSILEGLCLVRCSDRIYRKGGDCFFPSEGVWRDKKFPRVAKNICWRNEGQKIVHEFLKTIGVREVDEKVEMEGLLKANYARCSKRPTYKDNFKHLHQFIHFLNENPTEHELFQDFYIFMADVEKSVAWMKPSEIFCDTPFMDTKLQIFYGSLGNKHPLSKKYQKAGLELGKIAEFAKSSGANVILDKEDLAGIVYKFKKIEPKYRLDLSDILWRSLVGLEVKNRCYKGFENYGTKIPSRIYTQLQRLEWVPQKGKILKFVSPCDAVAEKLPKGFEYQTGWQWLLNLRFGENVEALREARRIKKQRQSEEYQHKEQVFREVGFESPEKAKEIAKLINENPEEFREWEGKIFARKERPKFPAKSVTDPERRQERLNEQLTDAPDKEYEKRQRSVRTTSGAIDPTTWLRNQYTNEADQMVCQICKEEMPFRKRDGAHYFEKKEALSKKYLLKEHDAQYLALCPLCAAMYEEFVKNDDDAMADLKNKLVSAVDSDVPITLGDQKTSIRFVDTHLLDLKTIIEAVE